MGQHLSHMTISQTQVPVPVTRADCKGGLHYYNIFRALVTATAKFFQKYSNKFGILLTYSYLCKRK